MSLQGGERSGVGDAVDDTTTCADGKSSPADSRDFAEL